MSPDHTLTRAGVAGGLYGVARCGLLVATLCVLAGPAHAGQAPPPPALVLSARAFGAVDKDSGKAAESSSGLHAELSYRRSGRRVLVDLQGSSEVRQRFATAGLGPETQWLAAAVKVRLSERTTLLAVQRLVYSPLYVPGNPGASSVGSADAAAPSNQGIAGLTSVRITYGLSLSRQMSRHTSATAGYDFDRFTFLNRNSTATSHRASVAIERSMRRNMSLHVRYGYVHLTNVVAAGTSFGGTHDVALGVAYSPRASRATTITFSLLPVLTGRQDPASRTVPAPARLSRFGIGSRLSVEHRFGRTWRTGARYQRTIYYLQGSDQPILANFVSVQAQGYLGRRVMAMMAAAASAGTPTLQRAPARVTSGHVSARVDVLTTRTSSIYAEYLYQAYASSRDISRMPGVAAQFSRSAFHIGVAINFGLSPGRLQPGR